MPLLRLAMLAAGLVIAPAAAFAAEGAPSVDGAALSALWVIPFVGILLSIAVMPLAVPAFWHHNYGWVAAFWALTFLVPFFFLYGWQITLYEFLHVALLDYVPFIILLGALFVVAGGVRLRGSLVGTPVVNTGFLLVGTLLASVMGTTGASMLLIRPVIAANAWRKSQAHVIVFFIFLVSNIGGSLTPIGDPPLFLGFLRGVSFMWTVEHMLVPMVFGSVILLALFFVMDTMLYRRETARPAVADKEPLALEGGVNLVLLGAIVAVVLASGVWKTEWSVTIYHVTMYGHGLARDLALVGIAVLSLRLTTAESRLAGGFSWGPILEVAKLFAGIFITIVPALAILRAGTQGALASVVGLVSTSDGQPIPAMYFWITGALSSFLDNAPTYLIFFNLASGDAQVLMTSLETTLLAISMGAVFMGANTYIGNAPNFMVKAVAEDRGVKMPSFFGYMAWSGCILIPLFVLMTFVFF